MKKICILSFLAIITSGLLISQVIKIPLYKDPKATVEMRVKDLLSRMTMEEKCRQIDIWHPKEDISKPEILKKVLIALGDTIKNGIGFLQFKVEMNQTEYMARFNAVQKYMVEETRLGIPVISNGEGCHGFVGNEDKSTVFPVSPPEKAPALIEGWYLGQKQGTAVANVIFGKVNPGGKLAVTIPRHVGQLPVYYNRKPYVHESPYINGEYSPLYPFGFGLSYTQFSYSNLTLSPKKVVKGEPVKVTVEVKNIGDRDGDEIVQLYIRDLVSTVTRPVQELKDFTRIHLKKGETKIVSFLVTSDKLEYFGLEMKRVVEPGEFEVQVGKSSADYLSDIFEVDYQDLKAAINEEYK